ncbi:uncharacterized protein [Brachionichthys hirsutus]|uniref:uncharacterized protein n=1 Tax=Brachionichthys hirsutus TaxID=412623 RepID=UPI003604B2A2
MNSGDDYYWKLVADFTGPQSGEGLELEKAPCKNRCLIQVGLLREENHFPWSAIIEWLKKMFPSHRSADFRRLIERGIAATLSLGSDARLTFLESDANFNFVGPICDSIGVERQHLLELKDFTERAQSIEVTNALILELSYFIAREKIAPIMLVTWLRNFNLEFCKNGNVQRAFQELKPRIKKLKIHCHSYETRSQRRNAVMENLLQSPFELVPEKRPKVLARKRFKRDDALNSDKIQIKEECESYEIMQDEGSELNLGVKSEVDLDPSNSGGETSSDKGDALTLLDIAMLSVQKLSVMYGGKTDACKRISFDLLRNQYILTCKEHPAMVEFEKQLQSLPEDVSLASPVMFLNHNANFLVDVHDAIEQQIMSFEKEIVFSTGEKLGRDKLPKFRNFVNLSESATSRYIRMACDVLSPRNPDAHNYRKHWVAFCEEKNNPSKLSVNESNRFSNYFEVAAGLIHHHKEISLFLSDLLSLTNDDCPNVILESVAADADDAVIQSLVCVLAVVYCKILGPYWQLLRSEGKYAHFGKYILCLYQRFLDWSKNSATMLEPEEDANLFLQAPLQEKIFEGVFQYCGQWHTNRDLIRASLKRTLKVIAAVTEEHLKDFLPGGTFSHVPSPDLSSQMANCTFSVLMGEYPFGHAYPYEKKRPDKSCFSLKDIPAVDSSGEDEDQSGSADGGSDESFARRAVKKGCKTKRELAERELQRLRLHLEQNMDRDYVMKTVSRNGGPCKTQQDVDKMLLRFDGKSRAVRWESLRCEILYQKMILNNSDPNLDCDLLDGKLLALKLKLALPRVKPGYSLVWSPRQTTKAKPAPQDPTEASS